MFVMWNWQWLEDSDSEQDGVVSGDEPGDAVPNNSQESGNDEEAEDDNIPAITHTVVFKCIGVQKSCITTNCLYWLTKSERKVKMFQSS